MALPNDIFHLQYFLVLLKSFHFSYGRPNLPVKLEPFKEKVNENVFIWNTLVEHLFVPENKHVIFSND